jgi:phospho-N-acetylmuramoyl-pentapeptide-transferase
VLFYLSSLLQDFFGPARLLQSYAVLISLALYTGFFACLLLIPRLCGRLPQDRGREFSVNAEAAKGKPTGTGVIFISIWIVIVFFFAPLNSSQIILLILTWLAMLTGYLDDRSTVSWGELRKGVLDLAISLAASVTLYYLREPLFWLPFVSAPVAIHPALFIAISTGVLWVSINTTNCTDGVDGLSGTLSLIALITMGIIFYFIMGHVDISKYLLVPHLADGAQWAVIIFAFCGCLMGYLWHNAFPSKVLMGDAGSRALGFFIGLCVMVSGNPFLLLVTSTIILVNGGTGLVKVALLRFFKIRIFSSIRFPLHDHMRKNLFWSPNQVLIKFMIMQVLVAIALLGVFFKIR